MFVYEVMSRRPISTNMLARTGSRKRSEMRAATWLPMRSPAGNRAVGHRVADLLVTDGKIALPPPGLWGLDSFRRMRPTGVSYFAQTPLGPCAYNTFSI